MHLSLIHIYDKPDFLIFPPRFCFGNIHALDTLLYRFFRIGLSLIHISYMDEDMRQLAAAAVNKLQAMTDSEFSEREFILTDGE